MSFNNFHMHTKYCDGANSLKEMAASALALGCREIGFSGHSWLEFDPMWTMEPDATVRYRETVSALKEDYEGQMKIFLGIEQDYCSDTGDLPLYEYVIGGGHCVFKDGNYISVDCDAETQRRGVEEWYAGDAMSFVEDYYKLVGDLYAKTGCDIVAHFDLITKFIERDDLIDVTDQRYIKAQNDALERLLETPAVFEINTGAISRGYRTSPYPSASGVAQVAKANKPVVLSSDSHAAGTILFGFEEAMHLVNKYDLELLTTMEEILAVTRSE